MVKKEKILFTKKLIAETCKCDVASLDSNRNIFIETKDTFFQILTFGNNAVIRAGKEMIEWCSVIFNSTPANLIFDSDNFYLINKKLRSFGKKLGEENMRYLHLSSENAVEKPLGFIYNFFNQNTVKELYDYREFDSALNFDRDVLAIAAYDGGKIAAVGGVDDYWGDLWQIGIDTVLEYRNRGLGVYLVKELALEIEKQGKVALYTTWSANIASTRVALGAGFNPVWLEYLSDDL